MSTENAVVTEENHLRRIVVIWIILSVVLDLVFWFAVGPHVPPGRMTTTAKDNQFDFNVLMVIGLPVMIGVWEWLLYAAIMWNSRRKDMPESVGGPAAAGNKRTEVSWIVITTVVVLFLAIYGTIELYVGNGSGSGEGPNPILQPAGAVKAEASDR